MIKAIKITVSLFIMLSFFSCTTSNGPLFVQEQIFPDSDPYLFIYRPHSTYLKAASWDFLIDGKKLITLTNATYAKIPIVPGIHEIVSGMSQKIGQPPLRIYVTAVKGKNIYVKYEIQLKGNILINLIDTPKFNNKLSEVEENQALNDLKELYLTTVPDRVP